MTISNSQFKTEVPKLHPLSSQYISFWREERRRCIEGYWVGGVYMPPALYFYINYATIKKNKTPNSPKSFGRPDLRDIDWDLFRYYTEARGFSGFALDPNYTSLRLVNDESFSIEYLRTFYPSAFKDDGTLKAYVPAREYLSKQHPVSLGAPLFENPLQNFMVMGARNWGKDLHHSTLLHYEDSLKSISEVKVNDRIYGKDGKLTTVTNVMKFTDQMQYEFKLLDGRTVKAGAGHKWFVKKKLSHSYETLTLTTAEILRDFRSSKRKDYNYFLPLNSPVEFPHKNLPLDPYLLGVLLGDGCITKSVTFTTADPELVSLLNTTDTITKLSSKYGYYFKKGNTYKALKELKLIGTNSSTKFIPPNYLRSSIQQRMELLRGLMDTDGHISKEGHMEYSTNSPQLAEDILFLLRSLGIRTSEPVKRGKSYRIRLNTDKPIFKLQRKLNRLKIYQKPSFIEWVPITDITPTTVEDSYCISVDNEDKLFLVNSFIPTHNSYSVGAGIVPHNFLFDGATSYSEETLLNPNAVEIIVGAEESNKSRDLLSKTKDSLERLPGKIELASRTYPSPFTKQYVGSFEVNREITAEYKKRAPGGWVKAGSKSSIKHRSFNANPFAAQGTRPLLLVLEEIGLFSNLKDVYYHSVDALRAGATKTGMLFMIGCVCAGTKVYTADGRVLNIEDLKQEDGIMGYDGTKAAPQTISYMKAPVKKACYRIETTGGKFIEVSHDHPFLASSRKKRSSYNVNKYSFVRAEELKLGDYLALASEVPVFGTEHYKHARLIGLMLGDGYFKGSSLSVDDADVAQYITTQYNTSVRNTFETKKGNKFFDLYLKGMKSEFRKLGLESLTKDSKKLPNSIGYWNESSVRELLAGIFDADGNVYHSQTKGTRVVLTNISIQLLRDVQQQLLKLGINSSIYKERRNTLPSKEYKGQKDFIYRLYVSKDADVEKFIQKIPLLHTSKCATLKFFKRGNRKFNSHKGVFELTGKHADETFLESGTTISNFTFETVKSIKFIGEKEVYNLSAAENHTYLANGFITHNTGGDMEKGTLHAQEMFYSPEKYDILPFDNLYENQSSKIGYFVPAYYTLPEFKDKEGITDVDKAKAFLQKQRDSKRTDKGGSQALNLLIQYMPFTPSEMFLSRSATVFPAAELRRRLSEVISQNLYDKVEKKVNLFFDPSSPYNGVNYELDPSLDALTTFPTPESTTTEGAVVIFELPQMIDDRVPDDTYIIGCDPFKEDDPTSPTPSLAAIYVMKTPKHFASVGHDEIVASYVGRPYMGKQAVNEILHKLAVFYNAKIYFENSVGNIKDYFEKIRKLSLLATQPTTVFNKKASHLTPQSVIYGYPMSNDKVKWEAIQYLRSWLLEVRDEESLTRNLDLITDPALLQELLAFSMTHGNYDRVMALVGCVIGLEEFHNRNKRKLITESATSALKEEFRKIIINNPKLFHVSATAPILPR